MYSYYTTTYAGRTIHIIKAQADSSHEVCLSVMADRYDSSDPLKLASDFSDGYLESNGFSKVGVINGGIFNPQYAPIIYANGIEVAYWAVNENDDSNLDAVMGIAHDGNASNLPIISSQSELKSSIGSYRGAITGAFGLIKNGVEHKGAWIQGLPTKKSGRSIVGKDSSGAVYLMSSPGVSPTTENPDGIGLSGQDCINLCLSLGLSDAVALDGGGSVSLIYEGAWKVSTTRQIKNVIGLYVKAKSDPGGGEPPALSYRVSDGYVPVFSKELNHMMKMGDVMVPINDIKIKTSSGLVSIKELNRKES